LGQLFDELKRRNVIRVAVAYLVAAWLVLQVADLVLEHTAAPVWVMQVFMLAFALGLPLVLVFSWAYEITPEGIKREREVERDHSITHSTGRKLDLITIALLIGVAILVGVDRYVLSGPTGIVTAGVPAVTDKSIAVLAFEDLSEEGNQEYFADGLSEELLNVLAQFPDLQVAGRTSSFAFKGQNRDLREIGEILNVAHILEGSVRKSGNRIRVTAQLVKASDGFHLFSETYDRNLTDVFSLQDEIAGKISAALQSRLMGSGAVQEATPTEIAAYDLYLLARQRIYTRNKENMIEALGMLDNALAIDPAYAPALAQKALVTFLLSDNDGSYGDIPVAEALTIARPLVDKALKIDGRLAEAHAISGLILGEEKKNLAASVALYRHALDLNPNLDDARNWLSSDLEELGRHEEAIALLEEVVARDPLYGPAFNNLVQAYGGYGDWDKSDALIGRVFRIVGETADVSQARGVSAFLRGELASAIRHFEMAYAANPSGTIVKLWYGVSLLDIGEFETALSAGTLPTQLQAHAMLGNDEQADSIIAAVDPHTGDSNFMMFSVAEFLADKERYGDLVAFVNNHYGDLNGLLNALPQEERWGTGYLSNLALAYRQLGMDSEYRQLLQESLTALQSQQAAGFDNVFQWHASADYAALTGDANEAVAMMQHILDQGGVATNAFAGPVYASMQKDVRVQEIRQKILARIDRERAKLGLPPFRPIAATN
jgi:TolB-like protein/tetratricopeptide (TPR) repeat protein